MAEERKEPQPHQPLNVVPERVHAFGKKEAPRPPRTSDFQVETEETPVGPGGSPLPMGASTCVDPNASTLTGHYHSLEPGTVLPDGLALVRDDAAAVPDSPNPPGHYTIFPTRPMPLREFSELFSKLPWQYRGQKKRS